MAFKQPTFLGRLKNAFAITIGGRVLKSGSGWSGSDNVFDAPTKRLSLSADSAQAIPAANACVSILAGTLARLPYGVITAGKIKEPVEDSPVAALLQNPSSEVDPLIFWETMGRALFSDGNAYAYISRDEKTLQPLELVLADCNDINRVNGVKFYSLSMQTADSMMGTGENTTVPARDVLHLKGTGWDWRTGYSPSPIQMFARHAVAQWALATGHHESSLNRGAHAPVMFEVDPLVKPAVIEKFKDELETKYQGVVNAGKSLILYPGMKAFLSGFSSVDLQLIEMLHLSIEDMARVWLMPTFLLQHFTRTRSGWTAANLAEQWTNFVRFSLSTHVERYVSEFNAKLLGPRMRNKHTTAIDTDPLTAGTIKEKIEAMEIAVSKGAFWTPEEGREYTGKGEIPDGQKLRSPTGAPPQEGTEGGGEDDEEEEDNDDN